jgi:hypothetical protein
MPGISEELGAAQRQPVHCPQDHLRRCPGWPSAALLHLSGSRDAMDRQLWDEYRAAGQVLKSEPVEPEPAPIAKSDAMLALEKKAAKIIKRDPSISAASAFAIAYERNPDLAAADRAAHLARGYGAAAP